VSDQETKGVKTMDFELALLTVLLFAGLMLGGMYLEQYLHRKRRNKHAH
jgi:hypothetical protein